MDKPTKDSIDNPLQQKIAADIHQHTSQLVDALVQKIPDNSDLNEFKESVITSVNNFKKTENMDSIKSTAQKLVDDMKQAAVTLKGKLGDETLKLVENEIDSFVNKELQEITETLNQKKSD